MIGASIRRDVEEFIYDFPGSKLEFFYEFGERLVIKFVSSQWAMKYSTPQKLKISERPALTWGTATYVTPLLFPISSGLYGRIGLVCHYDPKSWRIFDATNSLANTAYIKWARTQPIYKDLLLTVHSTYANHILRNQFRKDFKIDCVLFHPDQAAEAHTEISKHIWMAVTDWKGNEIDTTLSSRLSQARFTVLIDEDFKILDDGGLPIRFSARQIEPATFPFLGHPSTIRISKAACSHVMSTFQISAAYHGNGYVHVFIEP